MESFKKFMIDWNGTRNERAKLQGVYGVAGVVGVLLAGLAALVNDELSYSILQVSFLIAVVFFVNAVAWALIDSILLARLVASKSSKTTRK